MRALLTANYGASVGLNADWNCDAWHVDYGPPHRQSGDIYVLDNDDGSYTVVRRWHMRHGYDDGRGNDLVEEVGTATEWGALQALVLAAQMREAPDKRES